MKLATLKDGSRDGRLVVVSRDLTRCTDASFLAPTVQAALDDWYRISPHLAALSQSLEVGAVPSIRFHEHDAHAPLPRAYQHIGCSDSFSGPRDPVSQGGSGQERNAAIALIAGDRPDGSDSSDSVAILVALAVVPAGGADGVSAFSPVAVTPDEFEDGFQPLQVSLNGKLMAQDASPMTLDDLVAVLVRAEQARPIEAGAIIAAPSGAVVSLHAGDTLRVEMKDRAGHSIFGAIEQASASSHSG